MSGGSDEGGVVFMLRPPRKGQNLWAETVLYTFFDGAGGVLPGGLVFDSLGKLYGVARGGKLPGGVVFRLNPQQSGRWTYSVLYNLEGPPDGKWPQAALVPDVKGALYGTTLEGGTGGCTNGCGTVFEVNP
jgi:uncharacterized repeat protein (TIGR03803 family)